MYWVIGEDLAQPTRGRRDDLSELVNELERRLGQLESRFESPTTKSHRTRG